MRCQNNNKNIVFFWVLCKSRAYFMQDSHHVYQFFIGIVVYSSCTGRLFTTTTIKKKIRELKKREYT